MIQAKDASRIMNGALFPKEGEYSIDPVHSFVDFAAQHFIIGQVRGQFSSIEGKLRITDNPVQSSLEITIVASTINTQNKVRDEDLRSAKYLAVEKFPGITYRSVNFTPEPCGRWTIDGNLTICNITYPAALKVNFCGFVDDPWGKTRGAFHGITKINRRNFGLMADLDMQTGGMMIGEDIVIKFSAEFILQT